jgi:hypothetical protein
MEAKLNGPHPRRNRIVITPLRLFSGEPPVQPIQVGVGNPPKYVSDRLGIQHWQLGDAIHEIKAAGNLRATDRVIIYDDGMVIDEQGDPLGNIYDEL